MHTCPYAQIVPKFTNHFISYFQRIKHTSRTRCIPATLSASAVSRFQDHSRGSSCRTRHRKSNSQPLPALPPPQPVTERTIPCALFPPPPLCLSVHPAPEQQSYEAAPIPPRHKCRPKKDVQHATNTYLFILHASGCPPSSDAAAQSMTPLSHCACRAANPAK